MISKMKTFSVLVILVVSLSCLFVPSPALAFCPIQIPTASVVGINPSSGSTGTVITVTGAGLWAVQVCAYFDANRNGRHDFGEPRACGSPQGFWANLAGYVKLTLTVPRVPAGQYNVIAEYYSVFRTNNMPLSLMYTSKSGFSVK